MNEIEFVYFKKSHRGGNHPANADHISIHVSKPGAKSPTYRIDLNAKITKYITDKGCEFACVGNNKLTGQKYLVFNSDSENGYPVSMPTERNKKCVIYSRQMAEYLRNALNMKDDETRAWVSDDLSNTPTAVTIEIKRA